jgi:hypothetical protein
MTGAGTLTCPACASADIAPLDPADPSEEAADELMVDAAPPRAEPPNMRCNVCGHLWWAPDASKAR